MLKILQVRLWQYMNHELPGAQAGFRKGRGTRDQIANIHWIIKKAREFQKNIYFCLLITAKPLTVWITRNYGKFLKKWEYQSTWYSLPQETCLLRNLYAGKEATIRTGHGTTDWFLIRKGVHQGCHPAYLNYMQSTSCEMLGWMKHKLDSRLPGEISITSDVQMTPPYGRKRRKTNEPLDENERGEWKIWPKTQHSEN